MTHAPHESPSADCWEQGCLMCKAIGRSRARWSNVTKACIAFVAVVILLASLGGLWVSATRAHEIRKIKLAACPCTEE